MFHCSELLFLTKLLHLWKETHPVASFVRPGVRIISINLKAQNLNCFHDSGPAVFLWPLQTHTHTHTLNQTTVAQTFSRRFPPHLHFSSVSTFFLFPLTVFDSVIALIPLLSVPSSLSLSLRLPLSCCCSLCGSATSTYSL